METKAKRTPGPWKQADDNSYIVYGANSAVAVVESSNGINEAEANARLIAAAHDLLEFAQYAESFYNNRGGSWAEFGEKVKAVITKAEGRSGA